MIATRLAEYVGAPVDGFVSDCAEEATALVNAYIGPGESSVPEVVHDRAILEVGSELFHRRNAPNGVAQFSTMDGAPIRVARDPMVAARPLLDPYLPGGFA